jgi:hypothetical protein
MQVIGHIKNDSLLFSTVLWPGNRISGPPAKGRRTLRVVTAVAEPFVMEQQAFNDTCTTSVACLRVNTKDKEMLDDIFKDFENRFHNDSHPYNVRYYKNSYRSICHVVCMSAKLSSNVLTVSDPMNSISTTIYYQYCVLQGLLTL